MSNGRVIFWAVVAIFIGILFIFVGITILNIPPDVQFEEGSIEDALMDIPDAMGWACIFGGVILLVMVFLAIIVSAKS